MKYINSIVCFTLFLAASMATAQEHYKYPDDQQVRAKLEQWKTWKFGVLIHWGPYSEWGVVESWSLCPEDEGWCERKGYYGHSYQAYKEAYESIRYTFNPLAFQPEAWAAACKKAGMKYMVFTTKHHDGFCNYPSKYTDYCITDSKSKFSSHPKSNVVREVFGAFRNQGLSIGAYFSKPDWHNENYWWPYFPPYDRNVNYDPQKYPDRWKAFQQFTKNQIEEIVNGDYGKIDLLWLDGGWVRPEGSLTNETRPWLGLRQWVQDVDIPSIAAMARKYQPGMLVVDRTVHGEYENYTTPEHQIPDTLISTPWESCIPLGDSWYTTGPGERYKSLPRFCEMLLRIVSRGGNFLLGVGPDKTGNFVPEVYERLEEIGQWMDLHGQAIYNTTPHPPYQDARWAFTQRTSDRQVFAFYLPEAGKTLPAQIQLPWQNKANPASIQLLGYKGKLQWKMDQQKIIITIPTDRKSSFPTDTPFCFQLNTQP